MKNYHDFKDSLQVLLIEDNPADAMLTTEILKRNKLMVNFYHVEDGSKALKYLRKQEPFTNVSEPDLVLLDINLLDMDGCEVLSEIKNDPNLSHIPVIMLTVSNSEEDIQRTYQLGADFYATKPIGVDEFLKLVKEIEGFWLTIVKFPVNLPLSHIKESPERKLL